MLRRTELARKMLASSLSTRSTAFTLAPATENSAIATLAPVDPAISALALENDPMLATAATADPPVPPTHSPKLRQKVMTGKSPATDPTTTATVLKTLLAGKAPACDPMVVTAATAEPPALPTHFPKLRQKVKTGKAPVTDPTATAPVLKTLLAGKAPACDPEALPTPSSVLINIYSPVNLVINQMFSSDVVPSYPGPYFNQVRSFARPAKSKNRKSNAKLASIGSIKCANCSKTVCSKSAMDLHNKNDHPDMPEDPTTHVCNKCGNLYATKALLKAHICDVPPGNRAARKAALVAKMKAGGKSVCAVVDDAVVEEEDNTSVEEEEDTSVEEDNTSVEEEEDTSVEEKDTSE